MDVHQATISVAIMNSSGQLIMECLLETKAATIVEFIQGLHGTLSLTFEEGTSAAWLHDLLKPHVDRLLVCDPRKAALSKEGNKSDRIDARKLCNRCLQQLTGDGPCGMYNSRQFSERLLQLRVLRLGLVQDRDVRISILPEGKEILVSGTRTGLVVGESTGPRQTEVR